MPPPIPLATYRIQFTADFGFDRAAAIVPYIKDLGITHLYASPFLKARAGSTHGYDIIDHSAFNPELGGSAGFERLSAVLKQHDLGLILDFVPNHMGIHFADNAWWLDVLEWGQASPHAVSFDIAWDSLPYRTRGGVLLPILGKSYGESLESGDIELRYDTTDGSFSAWYFEHRLPIAPERYGDILRAVVRHADAGSSAAGMALLALADRVKGLRNPSYQDAPAFKDALANIADAADFIEAGLSAYRARPDRPDETKALHLLLERQHYKLGHWRLASSEINYRRFFDVNTLAGLRVEDAGTFDAIHGLVRRLIREDKLQGLRLDHVDGLFDPAQYCQRLRKLVRDERGNEPFYLLIEKILGNDEALPKLPGVHGTTGYEWMNVISQSLLPREGMGALDEIWRQVSNASPNFTPIFLAAKRRVLETLLLSEFTVLARMLTRIANGHYATRDFSADVLRQALELYVLHFPVYRTYLSTSGPSDIDRKLIHETIERARADWFNADEGLFDFLRDALTMDLVAKGGTTSKPRLRQFAMKVQQFTGPTMAKSLEDTAFYRYHRLLALNEVGGEPFADAMPVSEFHTRMTERVRDWPHGMTATATHDTKRGEDARMRILALAELTGEWTNLIGRWKSMNAKHIVSRGAERTPSAAFEYMLYQTLIGVWPGETSAELIQRVQGFALKAAREGKQETSWLNPNAWYEDGLTTFIAALLDPDTSLDFLASFAPFAGRVARLGALNSLSQLALKTMQPGVPDFYQGTEFWDLSMVDPDNRRPVDFEARSSALARCEKPSVSDETWTSGDIKVALTHHLLAIRARYPDLFTHGRYRALDVTGAHAANVIAFAREHKTDAVVVAVMKTFSTLTDGGRHLPDYSAIDATIAVPDLTGSTFDGGRIVLSQALSEPWPVALVPARRGS